MKFYSFLLLYVFLTSCTKTSSLSGQLYGQWCHSWKMLGIDRAEEKGRIVPKDKNSYLKMGFKENGEHEFENDIITLQKDENKKYFYSRKKTGGKGSYSVTGKSLTLVGTDKETNTVKIDLQNGNLKVFFQEAKPNNEDIVTEFLFKRCKF